MASTSTGISEPSASQRGPTPSSSGTTNQVPESPADGSVVAAPLWYGDLACGCLSSTVFPYMSFVAGHVFPTADPLGSGKVVLEYAINNNDQPYPGALPRGDVESPKTFFPGQDWFASVPVLVPGSVPLANHGGIQVAETFGPPYSGSMTVGFTIIDHNGANVIAFGNNTGNLYWYSPALDGQWHTITFQEYFQTDSSGFVRIWYDGVPQTFTTGGTTFYEQTMIPGRTWDGTHGNMLDIDSYRAYNAYPGTVTIYHGSPELGTTLASVESGLANSGHGP